MNLSQKQFTVVATVVGISLTALQLPSNSVLRGQSQDIPVNEFTSAKGNNLEAEANQSSFNDTLSVGDEIKICHGNNGNLCSGFVTITDPATGHGS